MKKSVIFVIFGIVAISASSLELRSKGTYDQNFVKSHAPPQHVIDGLKDHTNFFLKINSDCAGRHCRKVHRHPVWKFDSLPGYYIKRGIGRVKGRDIIQKYITDNNLNHYTTPKKYLYHVPGTGSEINDNNYYVVAEEIKGKYNPLVMTLDEAKQLYSLLIGAACMDLKRYNFIRDGKNRLGLIDTESRWVNRFKRKHLGWNAIFASKSYNFNTDFTQEALEYLLTKLKESGPISPKRYHFILKHFVRERKPHKWDFVGFFENLYPEYSQN